MESTIISIGKKAIDDKEPLLILFGEKATPLLKEYSLIQSFKKTPTAFRLQAGDVLKFDNQEYKIEHIGQSANENLTNLGHVSLVFGELPTEDSFANGIYLSPHVVPELHIGSHIIYPGDE